MARKISGVTTVPQNSVVLLVLRFLLTVLVLSMVAWLVWIAIAHPLEAGAQRVVDMVNGCLLGLLTGSCFAWFFNSSAGSEQHAATAAKQGEMLATTTPAPTASSTVSATTSTT